MLRGIPSILSFALLVMMLSSPAHGQATQPADKAAPVAEEQAWPAAVEALARALVNGDRTALAPMLASKSTIRKFGSSSADDAAILVERLAKSTLIGRHGYIHPPLVMAADIAADLKGAVMVPEKEKARFLTDEETAMKRSNATAVQWVVEQLDAGPGTPVGVIVLWTPRPILVPGSNPPVFDLLFILCRGEEIAPRQYRLNTIVYGQPLPDAGIDR